MFFLHCTELYGWVCPNISVLIQRNNLQKAIVSKFYTTAFVYLTWYVTLFCFTFIKYNKHCWKIETSQRSLLESHVITYFGKETSKTVFLFLYIMKIQIYWSFLYFHLVTYYFPVLGNWTRMWNPALSSISPRWKYWLVSGHS